MTSDENDRRKSENWAGNDLPSKVKDFPIGRQALRTSMHGEKSSDGGRTLNPLFVEWLMNLPQGWTASVPLEMPLSPWLRQWRSYISQRGLASIKE